MPSPSSSDHPTIALHLPQQNLLREQEDWRHFIRKPGRVHREQRGDGDTFRAFTVRVCACVCVPACVRVIKQLFLHVGVGCGSQPLAGESNQVQARGELVEEARMDPRSKVTFVNIIEISRGEHDKERSSAV